MRFTFRLLKIFIAFTLATTLASMIPFSAFAIDAHSNESSAGNVCLQPPQNTDLTKLSDQELISYGLPTHASLNIDLTTWSRILTKAKHRTCSKSLSLSKKRFEPPHSTNSSSPDVKLLTNNNVWADNEAKSSRGTYRAASMEFNVPTLSLSNSSADVAVWVGVGGDANVVSNPVLPQVGIVANASGNDSCNDHQYNESVWEDANSPGDNGAVNLPLGRLCVQDRVYAYVESNLFNSGYNYYYIANETIENYTSYQNNWNNSTSDSSSFSDSATGECVVERVTNGLGNLDPIADFNPNAGSVSHTIEIDNCTIYDRNDTPSSVGNLSHFAYQITNSSGTVLAYPGPLFNSGYDFLVHRRQGS